MVARNEAKSASSKVSLDRFSLADTALIASLLPISKILLNQGTIYKTIK